MEGSGEVIEPNQCETRDGMVCELVRGKKGWVLERSWD